MSQSYLGKGIGFPFRTNTKTGDILAVSEEENIKSCLRVYFLTLIGEVVFAEAMGVPYLLFENYDQDDLDAYLYQIRLGLRKFEPRVEVYELIPSPKTSGQLNGVSIKIRYRILSTGRQDELIFNQNAPFDSSSAE